MTTPEPPVTTPEPPVTTPEPPSTTTTTTTTLPPAPQPQTIEFGALPNQRYGGTPLAVPASATASSGLPVTFSTSTPAVCTSTGSLGASIVIAGYGVCTVTATQPGNAEYAPAPPVSRSFGVTD